MSVVQKHEDEATVHVLYHPYHQKELSSTMCLPLQLRFLMIALLAIPALLPAQEYTDVSAERRCTKDIVKPVMACSRGDGPTAAVLTVASADFHRSRSFLKSDEECYAC
jgi:hypothetical protein